MTRPDDDQDKLTSNARDLFERASTRIPAATANRLRMARRDALAGPVARHRWRPAITAVAAVLFVGILWWRPTQVNPPVTKSVSTASALDDPGVASDEDAELYAWLGDAPVAPESPGKAL